MKFKLINVDGFGCLKDWQSPELAQGLIVLAGQNESGKSTFLNLVVTFFYGWSPATRENNPFIPWGRSQAFCRAVLTAGDGRDFTVHRRLRSRPEGLQVVDNISKDIGNGSLPQVAFLPREIFMEVYALTVDQLRFPTVEAWQALQEKLLGGQYGQFLRPVRTVMQELENEAHNLWRPDKRGNPVSKQIQGRLSLLSQKLQQAKENEKILRQREVELDELNYRLSELLTSKTKLLTYLDRSERLYPVRKKLQYLEVLQLQAGNVSAYDHLPEDPERVLCDLDAEIEKLTEVKKRYLQKKNELDDQVRSFNSRDQLIYSQAERIKQIVKSYQQLAADRQTLRDLELDEQRYNDRLCERARDILLGGWQPELAGNLKKINEANLRESLASFKQTFARYQEQSSFVAGLKAKTTGRKQSPFTNIAAAFLFLSGVLGMLAAGNSPVGFAAALVLVLGLGLFLLKVFSGELSQPADQQEAERFLNQLDALCHEARQNVVDSLWGLPVLSQYLDTPEESLLVAVSRLKDLLMTLEDIGQKRDLLEQRFQEKERLICKLFQDCELVLRSDLLENINCLEHGLSVAEEHFQQAKAAREKLAEVEQQLAGLECQIHQAQEQRQHLLNSLNDLDGMHLQEKVQVLMERRKCRRQAELLSAELEREYPDLKQLKEEIRLAEEKGEGWIFADEDVALAKTERDQLDQQLNALKEEIGALKNDLFHRQGKEERLDDLEGEIAELKAEFRVLGVKRDSLMLLRNLLQAADHRFREEHQPDVLQKAGKYLRAITEGRYERLYLDDEHPSLMVKSNYEPYPLKVDRSLSRGTLEQIYLALRLALIEHLDEGSERVPLLLDEVLVNWDGLRLEKGLQLLQEIATQRQIFLFTCHNWLVERLAEINNVQVIELRI